MTDKEYNDWLGYLDEAAKKMEGIVCEMPAIPNIPDTWDTGTPREDGRSRGDFVLDVIGEAEGLIN